MTRVLLGQLSANGDCFYATILARQFKTDDPGCHLTWAVSRRCAGVLAQNPDVDALWEWEVPEADGPAGQERAWFAFEAAVLRRQQGPDAFDRICLSQIWPANFRRYDGTVRPGILRAYEAPITVPIDSTIRLSAEEEERVAAFVRTHGLDRRGPRILFECAANSGQSFVTPDFALEVAGRVRERLPDSLFILSTHQRRPTDLSGVVWADTLGLRENAALTHHCDLFVGCGSGLTVVATSGAAKELANIQILKAHTSVYASFHHDFLHYGKPADRFIEMGDPDAGAVAAAVVASIVAGVGAARAAWHRPLPVTFGFYQYLIDRWLLQSNHACDALESLEITMARYGACPDLVRFGRDRVLPQLKHDPAWWDAGRRRSLEAVCARLADAPEPEPGPGSTL